MLSKEDIIKLMDRPGTADSMPKNAVTSVMIGEALGISKASARYLVSEKVRAGVLRPAGFYVVRTSTGGTKVPFYLPAQNAAASKTEKSRPHRRPKARS